MVNIFHVALVKYLKKRGEEEEKGFLKGLPFIFLDIHIVAHTIYICDIMMKGGKKNIERYFQAPCSRQ